MKTASILTAIGLSLTLLASAAPAQAATPSPRSTSLVTVDAGGSLWSYSAPGNSKFGVRTLVATGWKDAKQVVSADWDDDGILDIVARWGTGKLTVSSGQSNGTYGSPYTVSSSGWKNLDITVTKLLRSDSFPGVVARDTGTGTLYHYPNSFGGGIGERTIIGSGWRGLNELTAVDFDRDGGMDIVARSSAGNLILYRTNGLGHFISESRKTVGVGWKSMTSINAKADFTGAGTVGLMARNSQGKLYYYPLTTGRINPGKQVGSGWNGYTIAEGVTSETSKATPRGAYETAYSKVVYDHVKKWCPNAKVTLNHYSVASGDIYGMTWWGTPTLAIRSDIPESITKTISLHECGHILQAKAFGSGSYFAAVSRMTAIYGGTGTYGLEENADCIAAYLNPYSSPAALNANSEASHWANSCKGYKGEAAKLIVQGKRP